jgi:hypothetical protein
MDKEKRKEMIRKCGPAHINFYFHNVCESSLKSFLEERNEVIDPRSRRVWQPSELIGKWGDIDRCDIFGKAFQASDSGYVSVTAMSAEELELLMEVERET